MRQAGRYQKAYRDLALKHPSFRERSENTDLIVEISLQPWNSFKPDGVILFRCGLRRCRGCGSRGRHAAGVEHRRWPWGAAACRQRCSVQPQHAATCALPTRPPPPTAARSPARSDILTPLPAFGIPFEIDDDKGPLLASTIRTAEGLKGLHAIDLDQLSFVGESLGLIRREVGGQAATLGFVGCPWTLATYVVEGASSSLYKNIKTMMFTGGWGGKGVGAGEGVAVQLGPPSPTCACGAPHAGRGHQLRSWDALVIGPLGCSKPAQLLGAIT